MKLTIERIFGAPALAGTLPSLVRVSPDGGWVTFVQPSPHDRLQNDLCAMRRDGGAAQTWINSAAFTNDKTLSEHEKARRERRRIFSSGIVEYEWSPDSRSIIVPISGVVYQFTPATSALRPVSPPGLQQTDAKLAPDGQNMAYVRGNNLFVLNLASGIERQLTDDGSDTLSNGLADFIAQEEMHRFEGLWWSPDSSRIAYTKVDTSAIPLSFRHEIDAGEIRVISQRYPFAGGTNAQVDLYVVDVEGASMSGPLDWRDASDDYLARVTWHPVGKDLVVQRQNRDQTELDVLALTVEDGTRRKLIGEHQAHWINLHNNLHWIDATSFTWTFEAESTAVLQRVDYRSGQRTELHTDAWHITRVHAVNGTAVYCSGWRGTPAEQHFLSCDAGSRNTFQLTREPGWHNTTVSANGLLAADQWSSPTQPARIDLITLPSADHQVLADNTVGQQHPYFPYRDDHPHVDRGHLISADGQQLWYRLTKPASFDPRQLYPVLVSVYGGPGVSRATWEWLPWWHHFLARNGIVVFDLDNRGSALRGAAFERPIHRRLGEVEVDDQLRGVEFLRAQGWVNSDRIAVAGHSYGGYMTLLLLAKAPGVFAGGIASAPVSDWSLYDTHYTERFMQTPEQNRAGYTASNVLSHIAQVRDPLLLVHGMADDNVLFTHSTKLLKALQEHRVQFEFMAYPGSKHGLSEQHVSVHRHEMMYRFLQRVLGLAQDDRND